MRGVRSPICSGIFKDADFSRDYRKGLRALIDRIDPDHRIYAAALNSIRSRTNFLWRELKYLPFNKNRSISCEIKQGTFSDIMQDLMKLSNQGGYFRFSAASAGYASDDGQPGT